MLFPTVHSACVLVMALGAIGMLGACSSSPKPRFQGACGVTARHGKVCSNKPWNDSGVDVQAGRTYLVTSQVVPGEVYADQWIPCTPNGPKGPLGWLFDRVARDATGTGWLERKVAHRAEHKENLGKVHRLRVLRDRAGARASFLTLIAAVGKDDSRQNVQVIGTKSEFTAHRSGRLYLFVNDWPGGDGPLGSAEETAFFTMDAGGNRVFSRSYSNNRGRLDVKIYERLVPGRPRQ